MLKGRSKHKSRSCRQARLLRIRQSLCTFLSGYGHGCERAIGACRAIKDKGDFFLRRCGDCKVCFVSKRLSAYFIVHLFVENNIALGIHGLHIISALPAADIEEHVRRFRVYEHVYRHIRAAFSVVGALIVAVAVDRRGFVYFPFVQLNAAL